MSRRADVSALKAWTRLGPDLIVPRDSIFAAGDGTLMALDQEGNASSYAEEDLRGLAEWLGTADDPMELIRDSDVLEASLPEGQDGARKYFSVRDITPDEAVTQLRELEGGRWISAICRQPKEEGGVMAVLASRNSPTDGWARGRKQRSN